MKSTKTTREYFADQGRLQPLISKGRQFKLSRFLLMWFWSTNGWPALLDEYALDTPLFSISSREDRSGFSVWVCTLWRFRLAFAIAPKPVKGI